MVEIPMLQNPGVEKFLTCFHLSLWVIPAEERLFFSSVPTGTCSFMNVDWQGKNCRLPAFKVRYKKRMFL